MGGEMQAAGGSQARREARALLETYFVESGFYTPKMTPRGRWVAEVFDSRGEEFPSEYLETSGHLDPGVAVRLHDTCAALYDGRVSVGEAYDAWEDWESVLKGFAEGYGLDSLQELMAIADPLTPEERQPAIALAPLDREALFQAMDWLKAYVVSYAGDDLEGFCDDTVAFAQLCVDRDRETGERDTPPSEEALREAEELDQVTLSYIDSLLTKYRVVDVVG
jgi:hypothetical protein